MYQTHTTYEKGYHIIDFDNAICSLISILEIKKFYGSILITIIVLLQFLANRTAAQYAVVTGNACIVAKWHILPKKCLNK